MASKVDIYWVLRMCLLLLTLPKRQGPLQNQASLNLALGNATLKVYNNSLAQKLLFTGNTIKGVSISSQGSSGSIQDNYVLNARKEVIVSAGTFQSPQLLMISGIGPRQTLESLGIPVLKDLPGVGQSLWVIFIMEQHSGSMFQPILRSWIVL